MLSPLWAVLWIACYTQEEIAAKVGTSEQPVKDALSVFLEELPKYPKASFLDENWKPPLYNGGLKSFSR